MDEIGEFQAKARRRRRLVTAIGLAVAVGVAAFAIWLSATTPKSTTFTRSTDLDPRTRVWVVGGFVLFVVCGVAARLYKDRR